jgi:hypothetical protein
MMALVRICGEHWHAVERDMMALNWLWSEGDNQFCHAITGVSLAFWRVAAVVLSSPPSTAVYHAETRGDSSWTPEARMLAGFQRSQANSQQPVVKFNSFAALPDYGGFKLDAMPADELVSRRAELAQKVRDSGKQDRAIKDVYRPGQRPQMVG